MTVFKLSGKRFVCVAICALFIGCASEITRVPTRFSPAQESGEKQMVIARTVDVNPTSGYSRTFKKGSTWKYVGRVPQGRVYAVQNDVFMLEGKHMREAYCVLDSDGLLVGFYLPVEQAFAAVSPPVRLPINFK